MKKKKKKSIIYIVALKPLTHEKLTISVINMKPINGWMTTDLNLIQKGTDTSI